MRLVTQLRAVRSNLRAYHTIISSVNFFRGGSYARADDIDHDGHGRMRFKSGRLELGNRKALGIDDVARAEALLRGAKGKRLLYSQPH